VGYLAHLVQRHRTQVLDIASAQLFEQLGTGLNDALAR
jgi:hypothetical protein